MNKLKLSILGVTLFLSLNIFAANSNWVVVNERTKTAATAEEIKKLLNVVEYHALFKSLKDEVVNSILAGEAPKYLTKLSIVTQDLEWRGPTTCQPDLSVLTNVSLKYVAYWSNGVVKVSDALFPSFDPCFF